MSLEGEIEDAIRNLPDNCNPDNPSDLTLPLCEHRAYGALCRAIESLKAKQAPADLPDRNFLFKSSDVFIEMQELYSVEILREVTIALADYLEVEHPCDCGVTEDPYLCGGTFVLVMNELFSEPATQ